MLYQLLTIIIATIIVLIAKKFALRRKVVKAKKHYPVEWVRARANGLVISFLQQHKKIAVGHPLLPDAYGLKPMPGLEQYMAENRWMEYADIGGYGYNANLFIELLKKHRTLILPKYQSVFDAEVKRAAEEIGYIPLQNALKELYEK